ncbi:MAG: glycosyltransferase family 2 protein [Candidatus Limnocylindrales bacterium]
MRVTVVTISLNQAPYLSRAMTSVLSQDYPDIEYIVVDPGSTDGSLEIIANYDRRLASVILEPDAGPAEGLSKGFRVATGDVFAYLNADDVLLPGAVGEAVSYLKAHPGVDVVYGDGYLVDAEGCVIRPIESSPFNIRRFVYGGVTVLQQATFVRRRVFDRVGGFNQANRTCWDGELLLDIAMAHGVLIHQRRMWGAFTIHSDSITGSRRLREQYIADQERLFRRVYGREWRGRDDLASRIVRVEKWLSSPRSTLRRLRSALAGPTGLRLAETADHRIMTVVDS